MDQNQDKFKSFGKNMDVVDNPEQFWKTLNDVDEKAAHKKN